MYCGEETFTNYRKRMAKTARELGYSKTCIAKIKGATTEREIERIMTNERLRLAAM